MIIIKLPNDNLSSAKYINIQINCRNVFEYIVHILLLGAGLKYTIKWNKQMSAQEKHDSWKRRGMLK